METSFSSRLLLNTFNVTSETKPDKENKYMCYNVYIANKVAKACGDIDCYMLAGYNHQGALSVKFSRSEINRRLNSNFTKLFAIKIFNLFPQI